MPNHWFTSDTHFYHKNILDFCKQTRPAESVEEMHEKIIAAWNERVRPEDFVYFLGDFSFGKAVKTEEILKRLKGNIQFVCGNHDRMFREKKYLQDYLYWFGDYKSIKQKVLGVPVILFHFPIEVWDRQDHGSVHLHGHTHGGYSSHLEPSDIANRMDVGIDTRTDFAPYSWDEIKEMIDV